MARITPLPCSKFVTSKSLSLQEYYSKKDKVLIIRDTGGLGDIFMIRMLFEDFKKKMPGAHIVVAAPVQYHEALQGHPYIDELIDAQNVNLSDYVITYNITSCCGSYEKRKGKDGDLHRSDIWAAHCGIKLENHNMHLSVPDDVTARCRKELEGMFDRKGPIVLFSPVSAMASKDLDPFQSQRVINFARKHGCNVACLHKVKLDKLDAPTITCARIIDFLGFINAADYIVSVDTSTFHAAGGLKKPMVGIFSWADGKLYGKWYEKWKLIQRHKDNGDWDCGPCYCWGDCPKERTNRRKPCITSITAEEIVMALTDLMDEYPVNCE